MVIAYLRVSTEKQNLENQKSEINRYAESKQIVVDRWITETVSGKTHRNERRLGNLIKKLNAGDILIVTEISRLSRSLHEIMVIMKYCVDNSVTVYSTKDGYAFDDSLNSKVLSFAFGLAAEIEHKLISQRTKEALKLRAAKGKHLGRVKGSNVKIKLLQRNKASILRMLEEGDSLTKIYNRFGVAQNTFRKFRFDNGEIDALIRERRNKED